MNPYVQDDDFTLYVGDALEVLRELPAESVHMCVTSPPFYGLRDYGTGTWEGGDQGCDHTPKANRSERPASGLTGSTDYVESQTIYRDICGKCGARRVDQQIGLEATPDEWVARLVDVFREVRRVLRADGTLWLEIGDSYNADGRKGRTHMGVGKNKGYSAWVNKTAEGTKPKDLIGAPWLLAFALRADGWYLRSDIIWARPNPMPESVRDRPTKSHSYLFLLAKGRSYFFDQEAVREPHSPDGRSVTTRTVGNGSHENYQEFGHEEGRERWPNAGRNLRSVWTIPTEPLPDEHYAAYPQKLVERCILAGTSERGCCPECGAPWERVVESELVKSPVHGAGSTVRGRGEGTDVNGWAGESYPRLNRKTTTTGWQPTCDHALNDPLGDLGPPIPCVVLDPFLGSGTTALVARRLGRRCIGIELSPKYAEMAARRTRQLSLLA